MLHDSALLASQLQAVCDQQKMLDDKADRLANWLTGAERRLHDLTAAIDKPAKLVQLQETLKVLTTEAISKESEMIDVTSAVQSCENCMKAVNASHDDIQVAPAKAEKLRKRLQDLHGDIADLANKLQLAVVQSQGVHDGLDSMLAWAKTMDKTLAGLKPVSVNPAVMSDQRLEIGVLKTDIDSHMPGLDLLKSSVAEMAATGKNKDSIKAEELKLQRLDSELKALADTAEKRENDVKDISDKVDDFVKKAKKLQDWITAAGDKLDMKDVLTPDAASQQQCVADVKRERDDKEKDFHLLQQLSQDLLSNPRTGDHAHMKDAIAQLGKDWAELALLIDDKDKEAQQTKDSEDRYKAARNAMIQWLDDSEAKLQTLETANGSDVDSQIDELSHLADDVDKQVQPLDELNNLGLQLDNLQHPELASQPRRSNCTSTTKFQLIHCFGNTVDLVCRCILKLL